MIEYLRLSINLFNPPHAIEAIMCKYYRQIACGTDKKCMVNKNKEQFFSETSVTIKTLFCPNK